MPPSGRKAKAQARTRRGPATDNQDVSDVETPETITTPSRSSRKRGRAVEPVAPASRNTRRKVRDTRLVDREDTEGTEQQDNTDTETEAQLPGEAEIIAHLKVADRHVNATEDFANDLLEGQEHVPGYGKIAGRDWAFIIRKVEINIGRPEAMEKLAVEGNGQPSGPSSTTVVDIDLGPDRQVSRSHAIISYESETMKWLLIVNGRNGLKVDNNTLKRGAKTYLRNGSVIEIANTQMAFITTAAENGDGPEWDGSIVRQAQKSSEDDDEGDDDARANNHRGPGLAAARSSLQDSSVYGNDFTTQQRRTHPHSQNATLHGAPPGTPLRVQQYAHKSSPAANYARGVMMESTETIDYSSDSAKDLKPPHSYAQLIGMAILSTHEQQMTLSNIYKWIMANYAFYRFNTGGWQNSIRHNLSLNKAFTKIARRTDEPGKGMKWMIEPTEFENFVQTGMKGCRRPNPMPGGTQSTMGSPNSPMHLMRAQGAAGVNGVQAQEEITPPRNSYRAFSTTHEAYTPERGPKRAVDPNVGLGINADGPDYDYLTRSTPRNNLTAIANAAGSPPALFINEEPRVGPLDTPFPLRPTQRLAPPSTLRRPSDFIQFSSPAPFWKMDGLMGSTPFRPYDMSPLKTPFPGFKKEENEAKKDIETGEESGEKSDTGNGSDEAEGVTEGKRSGSPVIQSSSPPRPSSAEDALHASPTLSRPASAVAKTLSQMASLTKDSSTPEAASVSNDTGVEAVVVEPPSTNGSLQTTAAASAFTEAQTGVSTQRQASNGYPAPTQNQLANHGFPYATGHANGYHDDGEDEGIDLAK